MIIKRVGVIIVSMLMIIGIVGACTPAPDEGALAPEPKEEVVQPTKAEVEATKVLVVPTVEAEEEDKVPCDLDEKTCEFLKGKDFTGQTLTVGIWGGKNAEIVQEYVIPHLEARGAKVELLLGGAGDRLAKIYAEKDNPTMDIAYLNIATGPQATKDGVTEPPTEEVPAYADLYDFAKSGCYGVNLIGVGIMYNTDFFDSPPEWEDLWTKAKGKVSLDPYPSTGTDALMAVAGRLAGGDEHDTDLVFNKIAELKPIPLVAMGGSDELNLYMNKGEVVAAVNLNSYSYSTGDTFENIDFSWPKDPGAVLAMNTLCVVKGTKVHDLALAWVQLNLSPKTQIAYAEHAYFGPTNSTVSIPAEVAERVVDGEEEVERLLQPDFSYIASVRKDLAERWDKEIIQD